MKKFSILFLTFLSASNVFPQRSNIYQSGATGAENLKAIANLSATSPGGHGFDTRYEGIKGTTRLFDTLMTSYLLIREQEKYIQFKSDIDVVRNSLVFIHPVTGKLIEVPSDIVVELVIVKDDKEMIYRTTREIDFEKEINEDKFYQVLKEGPHRFIKITEKAFVEADFKPAYSSDRRYDEYKTINKYYIEDSDGIFHQVQLNKKSLAKLFPDKKELIYKDLEKMSDVDDEEKVISVLEKF